jgi:hypothetical protein
MSARDFFDNIADVGSEEDDEDFDDETGQVRPKKSNGTNGVDDSSEEEDDDDEELLAEARHYKRQANRAEKLTEITGWCRLRRR